MGEPKPYYNADWQDDQTMDVLFSPFRENREINPQSWDQKMKFWTDMVLQECSFSKQVIIDSDSFPGKFKRKGKTPVCLRNVLAEMHRQGLIMTVLDFEQQATQGWASWGFSLLVKRPLVWSFGKVFGQSSSSANGEYVVLKALQEKCDAVLERHYSHVKNEVTDNIVEYKTLWNNCSDICQDEKTMHLVLMQLSKEKKVSITQDNTNKILRFATRNGRGVTPVSEVDKKILKLRKSEEYLQNQVHHISAEMERCRSDAKFYLSKGLKNSAKSALRRKKTLERMLLRREGALDNIQLMIHRIRDAESDKVILDAYSAGSSAYRDMAGATGLTTDNVDDVMLNLQETFDMQAEINASMAQGPTDPALEGTTTEELEQELEEILSSGGHITSSQQLPNFDSSPGTEHPLLDNLLTDMKSLNLDKQELELPEVPKFDPCSPGQPERRLLAQPVQQIGGGMEYGSHKGRIPQEKQLWQQQRQERISPQKPVGFSPVSSTCSQDNSRDEFSYFAMDPNLAEDSPRSHLQSGNNQKPKHLDFNDQGELIYPSVPQ